jgi:hypothetical protein
MTVAALSTAGFTQYISASSNVSQSQQAWQSLQQSLAQGNLAGAQSAFDTYSQLNGNPVAAGTTGSAASSSTSQFSTDMKSLGSAIGSGSLSAAQSAFTAVQNDLASSPSPAVAEASAAATQSVQWVDDLLSLSNTDNTVQPTADPVTTILDSAYGETAAAGTDPANSILDTAYGATGSGSASGTGATVAPAAAPASTPIAASFGNYGSAASVNLYA